MLKTASVVSIDSDPDYSSFERITAERIAGEAGPFFTTNAAGLFESYLAGIPAEFRQHYTCHCCRRFIETYGGLALIADDGKTAPVLWGDAPAFFAASVAAMSELVRRAKITGVFVNGAKVWGNPQTGNWSHLSGVPRVVFSSPLKTAAQVSAEKTQDYITLKRGLDEFPLEAAVQAVRVLEADAVDRSEKTLGVAQWLLALHRSIADLRGHLRDNLIWLAVAKAPPGWCHIRSTMISTLLDDIVQGLSFETIKSRWDAKMHPLRYQRPTALKEGNIEQANKIVAKLQSEGSLQRRFARLEEVTALWTPKAIEPVPEKAKGGGAFDHLKSRSGSAIKEVELPATAITWEKFRDTILPHAAEIEVNLIGRHPFFGLVTAVNADAPPMLQWDGLEGLPRNPVSWYFWHNGSTAAEWGLLSGWNKVDAVCLKPCHWQKPDGFAHQGHDAFFVLSAARDSRVPHGGFFPETLRPEYHEIRSAMEAYARNAEIAGREDGNANGIALSREVLHVRVKSKDGQASRVMIYHSPP